MKFSKITIRSTLIFQTFTNCNITPFSRYNFYFFFSYINDNTCNRFSFLYICKRLRYLNNVHQVLFNLKFKYISKCVIYFNVEICKCCEEKYFFSFLMQANISECLIDQDPFPGEKLTLDKNESKFWQDLVER